MSGRAVRLLAFAATVAALALPAAGCKTTVDEITGSVAEPRAPSTEAEWRGALETYGNRYRANPSDAKAAIAYAKALRATDQRAQAVAVLQQASIRNPHDTALLGAYGRALADAGQYAEALDALSRAHSPDNPDWRILNAQGAVLDEMGRHAEAQRHYATVLKMVPNEPSVLSNLGLSYALDKKLPQAEATLRQAAAVPHAGAKVRQNLALVVGLQGRFAEAEKIAGADLPPDQAAANVNYLRQMLAQRNDWKKMGRHMPAPDAGT
jgi:Flp pilus assembly protein TadD